MSKNTSGLYKPEEANMATQAQEWHWAVGSPDRKNSIMGTSIPISITNSLHTEIKFYEWQMINKPFDPKEHEFLESYYQNH